MRVEYLIAGACGLLTIGLIVLFMQTVGLCWKVKQLDELVYHIVKGDKIEVRKIDSSDRS